jgi:putative transposase
VERLTPDQLERRRRRAIALLARGLSLAEVAAKVGVTWQAVAKWKRAYDAGGEAALARRPKPGVPPRLSEAELTRLERVLRRLAASGVLTIRRAVGLVRDRFGVSYTETALAYRLRRHGWRRTGSRTRPGWQPPSGPA